MTEDINLENLMKLAATGEPKRDTYYENTFSKMLSGKKWVWNWSASLFGSFWLIYRKAYGLFWLMMALSLILSSVIIFVGYLGVILTGGGIWILIPIITMGFFSPVLFQGYMGNRFYLWSLKRKIKRGYHEAFLRPSAKFRICFFG